MCLSSPKTKTVQRSIFFYQVVGKYDSVPLSNQDVLRMWRDLKRAADHSTNCYLEVGDDEHCLAWISSAQRIPLKLQFGKTRKSGLPQIEGSRRVRQIPINPGEGINDLCHVVAFNSGVIGYEFNFHGPRISRLATYINEKTDFNIKFVSLLNRSAAERLDNLEGVTAFDVKVKSAHLENIRDRNGDLIDSLRDIQEFSDGYDIQLKITSNSKANESLSSKIVSAAKSLIRSSDNRERLDRLKVKGWSSETGLIDEVDLLSELLVSKQSVIQLNSKFRTISEDSAYGAVTNAYEELLEEIQAAIEG